MAMTSIYFVVRVDVQHPTEVTKEDLVEIVGSDMDYNITFDKDDIKIISTEICGTNDEL